MDTNMIEKVEASINNLINKTARIYMLVQDTKGNAKASIRLQYQIALTLKRNDYNPIILHEDKEYIGVSEWLGSEYMDEIPHESIKSDNLKISPEDFIIIPEIYGYVMEQLKDIRCGKIVLCQAYDNILETLEPGRYWSDYGFLKIITTTNEQKEYIQGLMKNTNIDVLKPLITDTFSKKDIPSKPIIAIHTRDQRDTMKIIKAFYLKYQQYRWFTFRDMRNMSEKEFSEYLKEAFVSVWVDPQSGFGTFPLESMASKTPVIGLIPNMKPNWMLDNNGVWAYNLNEIPDILADFIQNWLEDNISDNLYEEILKTSEQYKNVEEFQNSTLELFSNLLTTRKELFESQLEKIKVPEEN